MRVGDIEIDDERFEIRVGGAVVTVEPKVFDFIRFLAANPNRVVSKDELIDAVWDGRIVSDAALSTALKAARRALGPRGADLIRTVRGRGVRMDLPAETPAPESAPFTDRAAPVLTVLPVRGSPSGTAEDKGFASMLSARVAGAMARIPFMSVTPPPVARGLADATPAEIALAAAPGVALELTVGQGTGGNLHLGAFLFSVPAGKTLWTADLTVESGSEASEAILAALLPRLEPQLVQALVQSLPKGAKDPRALTLQALGSMVQGGWNSASFALAEERLQRALSAEPDLPFAHAALSLVLGLGLRVGFLPTDADRRDEAISHADRALALDGTSPNILGYAACALADIGQTDRAVPLLRRSLRIDPDHAQSLAALGSALLIDKQYDEGVAMMERALEVSPLDNRQAVWCSVLAMGYLATGNTVGALTMARQAVAADSRTYLSRLVLAAASVSVGDLEGARAALAEARTLQPDLGPARMDPVVGRKVTRLLLDLEASG